MTIKEAKAAGYNMPITSDHGLYPYMDDRDNDGMVGEYAPRTQGKSLTNRSSIIRYDYGTNEKKIIKDFISAKLYFKTTNLRIKNVYCRKMQ